MHEATTELAGLADLVTPLALRAAVTLGLPAAIGSRSVALGALADELAVDPPALRRLVGFLAARGVVAVDPAGTVRLTAIGAPLAAAGSDWSTRLDWTGAGGYLDRRFAGGMLAVLRTGRRPGDPWAEIAADPALATSFDLLMTTRAAEWVPAVAGLDVWAGARCVVDVGGGRGHLLAALLTRWPDLRGVLVERPGPAAAAADALGPELAHRVDVVVGDFREALPPGGDRYVLAHVLHDWDDDTAATVLRRAADAATAPGARVLVVERLLDGPPGHRREVTHQDLRMLVLFGGHERTHAEFTALAATAGLRVCAALPTSSSRHVLVLQSC
ncbi:methyltransferase [Pseudonocardia benzenivorans]|uniref:O-methyltransferase family 2 n=2 Tax=Pseudonocardia TaxID=1847 RepID=F4CQR8_PSEUX|nr:methyltransferase [Pseudonocardia dioxanivorans]AEA23086.1 O-methyltransferase family 2 [Pseudonocardia dioxanivorans CB1190]